MSTLFTGMKFVYGVEIVNSLNEVVYSPVYPFVLEVEDTVVLEEFLEDYTNAIIDFCHSGAREKKGFSEFLYRSPTEAKYWKDRMYYRGIYVD